MIKIEGLKKKYKDFTLDISLEVPDGSVTGLIGKNGAGKSTTIKAILGLIRPDEGSVQVLDKDSESLTVRDKEAIGTALSDSGFSQYLNTEDVIHILKKMYHSFREEDFRRQCREQGLPFDKPIREFSTGMKAKLRVLVAMCHDARLLILDEPTSGLDVLARNEILDMLRTYLEEDPSRSILISSHISSDLESLCDDIYMIHQGKILLHEDTDTILGKYGVLKVDESTYAGLDQRYLLRTKKESFGYTCLTNEKQYYIDNYPDIVIENSGIDQMILLMLGRK